MSPRQRYDMTYNKLSKTAQGDTNPKPRHQFDIDFLKFIILIQQQGHRIIIIGDFNKTIEKSKLLQNLQKLWLMDMIQNPHHNTPKFRTCLKGTNIIDYALCSLSVLRHITASTYEPFYFNVDSDHWGIIIDFNQQTLFGRQDPLATPSTRGIGSTDISTSDKYLHHLSIQWKLLKIDQWIQSISPLKMQQSQLRYTLNSMLKAEKHSKRQTRLPWSPELKEASLGVKLFKLYFWQIVGKEILTSAIQETRSKMNTIEITPKTKQECQTKLRKAQKQLRKIRQKANEKRTQHLDILAQQYNIQGDRTKASIIKWIQRAEATKRCYQKLQWILKPPKPGVTFIQQKTKSGSTETLYDRRTIEHAILKRNQTHFNQCSRTPFTAGRLRELNWAADSPLANAILQGQSNLQEVSEHRTTQLVLKQCNQRCQEQKLAITREDLKNLFKRWRESTTTSPSGRHLGLYKCIFINDNNEQAQTMAANISTLTNMLQQNGIGLHRWRKVTNMMIHKLDGPFLMNKLRVIHLFEADYNGTIGILFNRKILYHAEEKGLLNNNQCGCQPHRQAEDALIFKELTYNLSHLTKTTLATFDNDATGCFDRVPCTITMLASCRLGADINLCRMQADTLQNVQHQLQTAFGLSKATYTSNDTTEIHGQGQGSRAGPPTWVFVSSLLLDCMTKHASGVFFTCPRQELSHHGHNDAFVDDVTGYVNHFIEELKGNNVQNKVLQTMQKDATLWNNLLHTSGGKLALQKCLYYIVAWQWKHGHATPIPLTKYIPKSPSIKTTMNRYQSNTWQTTTHIVHWARWRHPREINKCRSNIWQHDPTIGYLQSKKHHSPNPKHERPWTWSGFLAWPTD